MEIARAREYIFTAILSIFSFSDNIFYIHAEHIFQVIYISENVYFREYIFHRSFPNIFLFTPSHNMLRYTQPQQKAEKVTTKMEICHDF